MSEFKEDLIADVTNEDGLTEKEVFFLDVLFDKCSGNVRAAMTEAGYPKDAPTAPVRKKLAKHIKDRTKDFLSASSGVAAITLVNVLVDPNQVGAKNIIAAAKDVLDRGGVYKEEGPQVTEIRNMFILPAKDSVEDDEEE
jgi:hypothetical protein